MATKQTSLYVPLEVLRMLDRLLGDGWGNIPTVIAVAVDRMFWDDKRGFRMATIPAEQPNAPAQAKGDKRIRLLPATQDQIQHFLNAGWPTQQSVIVQAIKGMNGDSEYLVKEAREESREAIQPGDYHYFNPRTMAKAEQ